MLLWHTTATAFGYHTFAESPCYLNAYCFPSMPFGQCRCALIAYHRRFKWRIKRAASMTEMLVRKTNFFVKIFSKQHKNNRTSIPHKVGNGVEVRTIFARTKTSTLILTIRCRDKNSDKQYPFARICRRVLLLYRKLKRILLKRLEKKHKICYTILVLEFWILCPNQRAVK